MISTLLTPETLIVLVDGKTFTFERNAASYEAARQGVLDDQPADFFERLAVPFAAVKQTLTDNVREPLVEIVGNTVLYNGAPIHEVLIRRILDVLDEGFDVEPWLKFVKNLYANPSITSREEIYLFMEKANLPMTSDGHLIAYKRVRDDYMDIHSGTFDNSVGKVCEMDRNLVDPDRRNTCSVGLHFCSKDYLPYFGNGAGNRVVLVKINPADIVSIPNDYDNTKGRTWRYEVVGEIDGALVHRQVWPAVADGYGDYTFYANEEDIDYDDLRDF